MKFFEYLNYQKPLPSYLVEKSIEQTKKSQDTFIKEGELKDLDFYRYDAPEELIVWIKQHYNFTKDLPNSFFSIQGIKYNIPIHIDRNRIFALNYILYSGGDDVYTSWYDQNKNHLHSEFLKKNLWHKFNTGIYHGVHGLSPTEFRIAVSVDLVKLNLIPNVI